MPPGRPRSGRSAVPEKSVMTGTIVLPIVKYTVRSLIGSPFASSVAEYPSSATVRTVGALVTVKPVEVDDEAKPVVPA